MLKKQTVGANQAMRKPVEGDNTMDRMDSKFKRVMDWGTPRLVTKNRQVTLNATNSDSRNLLMKFANTRNGDIKEEADDKPKQEFN